MTSDLDRDRTTSRGDRARSWAYLREFLPAMLAYCIILPLVLTFGDLDGTAPSRYVWALLPLLPALAIVVAVWRHLRRIDEFQRLLLLEALSIGFGAMVVAAVTFGFLALAGLQLQGMAWYIFAIGMAAWGVGSGVVARRGAGA